MMARGWWGGRAGNKDATARRGDLHASHNVSAPV